MKAPTLTEEQRQAIIGRLGLEENTLYTIGKFEGGAPVRAVWEGLNIIRYGSQDRDIPLVSFAYLLPASPGDVQIRSWDADRLAIKNNRVYIVGTGQIYFEKLNLSPAFEGKIPDPQRISLLSKLTRLQSQLEAVTA